TGDTRHAKIPLREIVDPGQHEAADARIHVYRDSPLCGHGRDLLNRVESAEGVVRCRHHDKSDIVAKPLRDPTSRNTAISVNGHEIEFEVEIGSGLLERSVHRDRSDKSWSTAIVSASPHIACS